MTGKAVSHSRRFTRMCDEYISNLCKFLEDTYADGEIDFRPGDGGIISPFDYGKMPKADFVEYDQKGFWNHLPTGEEFDDKDVANTVPNLSDHVTRDEFCVTCLSHHERNHEDENIVTTIINSGLDIYARDENSGNHIPLGDTHVDSSGDLIFDFDVEDDDKLFLDRDKCVFAHKSKTDEEIERQILSAVRTDKGNYHFLVEKDDYEVNVIRVKFLSVVTICIAPSSMEEGFYKFV